MLTKKCLESANNFPTFRVSKKCYMLTKCYMLEFFCLTTVHTLKKKFFFVFFFFTVFVSSTLDLDCVQKKIFFRRLSKPFKWLYIRFSTFFASFAIDFYTIFACRKNKNQYVDLFIPLTISYGHIIPKAPDPVRSPQLNGI